MLIAFYFYVKLFMKDVVKQMHPNNNLLKTASFAIYYYIEAFFSKKMDRIRPTPAEEKYPNNYIINYEDKALNTID